MTEEPAPAAAGAVTPCHATSGGWLVACQGNVATIARRLKIRERRAKLRDLDAPTTVRVSHVAAAWLVTAPRLDPAAVLAAAGRYVHGKPYARWR